MSVVVRQRVDGRLERSTPSPLELLPLCLVLGFAAMGLLPLGDPDVWWHLRTGELVVEEGFTRSDPWSWTSTETWLLHEWLSEVVMFLSYDLAGYHGVIVLRALMLAAISVALARSCRAVAGPGLTSVVLTLTFVALFPFAGERPQLVSFLLLALLLPRLRKAIESQRAPWELIPAVWLWANLHLMWVSGLVFYGALVLGLLLQLGPRQWRRLVPFVGVGALSGVAAALTPNGPALLLMPFGARNAPEFITEFAPPSIQDPFVLAALAPLAVVVIGWARTSERVSAPEICFVATAAFVGLSFSRTVPLMAIAVAPLAARTLQSWHSRTVAPLQVRGPNLALGAVVLAAFVVLASVWLPQVPGIKHGAPFGSTRVLDDLPGRAKVINEYELGGWLLWSGRDTSPGIDGRAETRSLPTLRAYLAALKLQGDWQQFVRDSDADAAWLRKEAPLVYGLEKLGWEKIHEDDFTYVLVPPTSTSP